MFIMRDEQIAHKISLHLECFRLDFERVDLLLLFVNFRVEREFLLLAKEHVEAQKLVI